MFGVLSNSLISLTVPGQQRGPVISRMVLHKWHEGDIDGLTLVYSSLIGEWKKISEVAVLKEAISKLAAEEQAGMSVLDISVLCCKMQCVILNIVFACDCTR